MIIAVLLIAAAGCLVGAFGSARIARWHRNEAVYWHTVSLLLRQNPALHEHFWPVLERTFADHPTLQERLSRWRPPHERFGVELPFGATPMMRRL